MRLIVEYVVSDECTYSCTVAVPVNAESKELLEAELRRIVEDSIAADVARSKAWDEFHHKYKNLDIKTSAKCQMEYYADRDTIAAQLRYILPTFTSGDSVIDLTSCIFDGQYFAPSIYTVDEWFEQSGLQ